MSLGSGIGLPPDGDGDSSRSWVLPAGSAAEVGDDCDRRDGEPEHAEQGDADEGSDAGGCEEREDGPSAAHRTCGGADAEHSEAGAWGLVSHCAWRPWW